MNESSRAPVCCSKLRGEKIKNRCRGYVAPRHRSLAERYVGRIIRTRCQDGGRLLNSCPAKKKLETSYQMVRPLGNWRVVGQNKVVIIRIIPLYTMLFNISNKCYITSYHIIIYISFHFLQHFVLIQLRKSGGAN